MKGYKDITGDGGSNILGQMAEQHAKLQGRMEKIRYKIAVLSGKGGVGKSAITGNLAAALSLDGYRVGVLDADINGPTLAKMLGVRGQRLRMSAEGVHPALSPQGLRVLSMDLLLPSDDAPVDWKSVVQGESYLWRGTVEANVLREFLADTVWEDLDFLLVDLPPGTDRLPTLASLVSLSGAILVTIPSEVSQLVVRKSITVARELPTPIAGLVENMAGYACQNCGSLGDLFPLGNAERMAEEVRIPYLGRIPFDSRIGRCGDLGVPFVSQHPASLAGQAFQQIAVRLKEFLGIGG
ncbi:MAG TPA: Mrp/NBP35 family ATP-binding protein [bacterium]|nr:Mrp/NBP35 family ATP-binding protein [bacterium]